ncbi:class II aldolase/adducin family protein [Marivita sp. XM-24bin2]|jgi:L-fuculose-phosphate aldolase|uniref:class II aldolase/adducin family protein n=1 Tax=unclassified Marivita TaxID=2632480 RepID=UPI000D7AB6B8|nr:class II aldolase/adducin family protein [Marivita sp. XM-24bin2]MCR9108984.1 class II aldolase/adducin family protein [Paracoccaceae bacterium]PWL36712.1 MAG: class II aldolase [Marivita sp. XM-24bin2]
MTPADPLPDTKETRQALIDACLWMNERHLNQGTSGNISARIESGILITPSGVPYDALTPEAMVTIPLSGSSDAGGPKPSSEWPFHQGLHQARPDMPVVLHAHPPYCSILAVQRRSIPACHYMIAAFGGADVPLADYALFGSPELCANMADIMSDRHGCLMANHGATVLGETVDKARWRLEELETLARTYLFSSIGGAPHILSDEDIAEVLVAFQNYGPRPVQQSEG